MYSIGEKLNRQSANQSTVKQNTVSISNGAQPLMNIRESYESLYPGSVTYMRDNKGYRAYINSLNSIQVDQIFLIDRDQIAPQTSIKDVFVSDQFVLIAFDNNTFSAYLRPKTINPTLKRSQSGYLSLNNPITKQLIWQFVPIDSSSKNEFYLYSSPNTDNKKNILQQHRVSPVIQNGQVVDVVFAIHQITQLKETQVSAIEITSTLVAIGCSQCNSLQGRTEFYDKTNMTKLFQVSGQKGNYQFGTQIDSLDKGIYQSFYIKSDSGGRSVLRQHYLNHVKIMKNDNTGQFGYEVANKLIQSISSSTQNGIKFALFNDQLVLKYDAQKTIYGALSCDYQNSFNPTTMKCELCPQESPLILSAKNPQQCSSCNDLYYAIQLQQKSTYLPALFSQQCKNFDASSANNSNSVNTSQSNNGNISSPNTSNAKDTSSNFNEDQQQSDNDLSTDKNRITIIVIPVVLVSAFFITILTIIGCILYKRWKNKKSIKANQLTTEKDKSNQPNEEQLRKKEEELSRMKKADDYKVAIQNIIDQDKLQQLEQQEKDLKNKEQEEFQEEQEPKEKEMGDLPQLSMIDLESEFSLSSEINNIKKVTQNRDRFDENNNSFLIEEKERTKIEIQNIRPDSARSALATARNEQDPQNYKQHVQGPSPVYSQAPRSFTNQNDQNQIKYSDDNQSNEDKINEVNDDEENTRRSNCSNNDVNDCKYNMNDAPNLGP